MRKATQFFAIFVGFLFFVNSWALAEGITLEDYYKYVRISSPLISPDGGKIIYRKRVFDRTRDRSVSEYWIVNSDGSGNRLLLTGSDPAWSPDGSGVAYLDRGADGETHVFLKTIELDSEAQQITSTPVRAAGALVWSPNGEWLAVRAHVPGTDEELIEGFPSPGDDDKWARYPTITEDQTYLMDGGLNIDKGHTHLFIIPKAGGPVRQITSGNWDVGARYAGIDRGSPYAWSPDSRYLYFDGFVEETKRFRFFESHIYQVDIASLEIRKLTKKTGHWRFPVPSPDGQRVAFMGFPQSELSWPETKVWIGDIDRNEVSAVPVTLPSGPYFMSWGQNSQSLLVGFAEKGTSNLAALSLDGELAPITRGNHYLSPGSISRTGIVAGTLTSTYLPRNLVLVDLASGEIREPLTSWNAGWLQNVALGEVEEVWSPSTDGVKIQGWVVKPPGFRPDRKYPLILYIHGGPHQMYDASFDFQFQELAAAGYVVLYTNPRGSDGYGPEFANAIDNAFPGKKDFEDLMASVDHVAAKGFVDTKRLYVTGCSGGGTLVNWIVTQTDRFAAAVSQCSVSNWISFAATSNASGWGLTRFRPGYWEDPARWIEHSPVFHAADVTTPTLLVVGDRDSVTPVSQSQEFYAALKMNNVPARLVILKDQGHGNPPSRPSNFFYLQALTKDWFARWTRE